MTTAQTEATTILDAVELLDSDTSSTEMSVALGRVLIEQAAVITGAGLPVSGTVTVQDGGGSLTVDGSVAISGTVPVTDNGGSLTVDGALTSVATITNVVHVDDNGGSLTVDGTVAVSGTVVTSDAPATTGAATAVAMTSASATLIVVNSARIGLIIFNPLSVTLYVRFENADAATVQTFRVLAGETYEMPRRYYTGIIKAALASSTGNVFVTELT